MNKNNKLMLALISTIATTSVVFAMSGSDPATTPEDPTTKTITATPAAEESKEESVTTTTPVSKPAAPSTPSVAPEDPSAEAKAAYESKLSTAQAKLGEAKVPATAKLKELNELKTQMAAKQKELLTDNKAVQIANQKIVQIKAAETKRLQDVAKKTATAKAAAVKAGTDFVMPTEDPALKTAYEAKLQEAGSVLAKAKETVGTKTGELEAIKDALTIKQTEYGITHKAVVAEQNKVAKIKADEVKRIQDVAKKAAAEKVAAQKAAALRVAQEKAAALKAEKDKIEAEKAAALQAKLEKEQDEAQKAEEALQAKIAEEEAAKQRIKEEEAKIAAAQRALEEAKKEAETKHAATEVAKKVAKKEKQESDAAEKQVKQNQTKKKAKK
ncbi:MAG: hypothetical protein ACRCYP_05455 [Alphaproteobacteria bacterium]